MHFLAFLIAGISITITVTFTALLPEISDAIASANLPLSNSVLSDSLLSDSSSSNPTAPGNEPNSFDVKLPIVPSQNPDIIGSISFSPSIAQKSDANSADQPSALNPSTLYTEAQNTEAQNTEAQTYTDNSNEMCYPQTSTGQRRNKRQSCIDLSQFVFPRMPLKINQAGSRGVDKKNQEILERERSWKKKWFFPSDTPSDVLRQLNRLSRPGREICSFRDTTRARPVDYLVPVCCLGPEEIIRVPLLGPLPISGQEMDVVNLLNVENCLLFLLGRPYCAIRKYCCKGLRRPATYEQLVLGSVGVECIPMPVPWFNTKGVSRFEAEPSDVREDSADSFLLKHLLSSKGGGRFDTVDCLKSVSGNKGLWLVFFWFDLSWSHFRFFSHPLQRMSMRGLATKQITAGCPLFNLQTIASIRSLKDY